MTTISEFIDVVVWNLSKNVMLFSYRSNFSVLSSYVCLAGSFCNLNLS